MVSETFHALGKYSHDSWPILQKVLIKTNSVLEIKTEMAKVTLATHTNDFRLLNTRRRSLLALRVMSYTVRFYNCWRYKPKYSLWASEL